MGCPTFAVLFRARSRWYDEYIVIMTFPYFSFVHRQLNSPVLYWDFEGMILHSDTLHQKDGL